MISSFTRVNLGPKASFEALPAKVSHEGQIFYLIRAQHGYELMSAQCPHQGGRVVDRGSFWECPVHGWRFERLTGACVNAVGQQLSKVPVFEENGILYAEIRSHERLSEPGKLFPALTTSLTVQLIAHACLGISHEDFLLITDPWLYGPAFLGSWTQYPPSDINPSLQQRTNSIVITHEHSDHFHEQTLTRFERHTPVYFPDFPNRRIEKRLIALGFRNARPMAFGKAYAIGGGITITSFPPESLWNDAILLIEVGGVRILNINDAGINYHIASQVGPVDVLACQFSAGASAYPRNFNHLSGPQKREILERSCAGTLRLLRDAAELYQAKHLLPIASHFLYWHPCHREYAANTPRNTIDDVVAAFHNSNRKVIDILPGDTWDLSRGVIERGDCDRQHLYEEDVILRYLEQTYDAREFERFHPRQQDVTRPELARYLLEFNKVPEVALCEDVTVDLIVEDADLTIRFEVKHGHLTLSQEPLLSASLMIYAPARVLAAIIREDLSWDEALIGHWCRLDRSPDVYHPAFWRLLQARYYKKSAHHFIAPEGVQISAGTSIQQILEQHGADAERILNRYGLYCSGCSRGIAESLLCGSRKHGVTQQRLRSLVIELNSCLLPVLSGSSDGLAD